MCNHLKSRRKQKVIHSRFNFPASQCIPVCGATFTEVRVHSSPCADLDKTWTSALRCSSHAQGDTARIPPWSLSKFNASHSGCRMYPKCAFRSPPTTTQHRGVVPFCKPIVQLVCRPTAKCWRIEPDQQEAKLRRFYPYGSSPPLCASMWRGHCTDLPGFADVQFDRNNETGMSICPSSHPVAPLKKSVSSQHTVSHQRAMSTWSFGTGQENHVVCLKE